MGAYRLLQINITSNQGSTGKIAEQIGLLMKKCGWEVFHAHGARYINPSKLETYQIQSKIGEYLHALKSFLFDADALGSTQATHRLVGYIKAIKPDIIHIHNLHGYYLNFKVLFEYLNTTDIPVVMTFHDCWNFTGHCVHFVTANCDRWKSGCGNCPQIHSVPKSLFFDNSERNLYLKNKFIASNKNLHLVGVSKWIENLIRQSIYKTHPIYQIYNGIDLDVYRPSKEKSKGKFQILGVGNPWSKDKGLYDIFKLRELLPIDKFDITLVGLNERQKKNLSKGIKGVLKTSNQQELVDLYSASNVFINPSYADTLPTTNIEALACGTPVITYRTGGCPETIDDSTGIVVNQGDVEALAKEIMAMVENPLSSALCRERAIRLFNKDERFAEYVNLYEKLINQ